MKNIAKSKDGSFANSSVSEIFEFNQKISKLNYSTVPPEEILEILLSKKLDIPDRADAENALQRQVRYISTTGYFAHVHTGMIKFRFSNNGSSWVIIKDSDGNVVWMREFYRNIASSLMSRLSVFMQFAKNVADYRPEGMNLVKISETDYEWRGDGLESKIFDPFDYLLGMTSEDKKIFKSNHNSHIRYLKRTEGKVRREYEFRKTWKKKK